MMFSEVKQPPELVIPISDGSIRPLTSLSTRENVCKGNGGCLILASNTLSLASDYVQNPNIHCDYKCHAKQCPNYLFCKRKCPEWVLQCNCGLCDDCSSTFGMELLFVTKEDCNVCQEKNTTCVQYKHCSHHGCLNCISYSFYGTGYEFFDVENEPKFPYQKETEEEYYDDQENKKWEEFPLIQKYLKEWNKWDERRENMKAKFLERQQHKRKTGKTSQTKANKTLITEEENDNEIGEDDEAMMLGVCPICKQ
jgi:hypothetical protein